MATPVRRNSPSGSPGDDGTADAALPGDKSATGPIGENSNEPLEELERKLSKEFTEALRMRQQFGSGGTRSPSGVTVERIKLLAAYFNTVAAGLLTAGLVGPMAAYLYGFANSARSALEIAESVAIVFSLSIILHLAGRSVLGRLAS